MSLLALLCSPRRDGVSATLGGFFLNGFQSAGGKFEICQLDDYNIIPCKGCNACFNYPHKCLLENEDDVPFIYKKMHSATILLFASPIFFYGLPAHLKALIDRGQLFYAKTRSGQKESLLPPAIALFCAARKNGKMLFTGAYLTMKWFLKSANSDLTHIITFKNLENKTCITQDNANFLWLQGFLYGLKCNGKNQFLNS